jgi:hypothetical protein
MGFSPRQPPHGAFLTGVGYPREAFIVSAVNDKGQIGAVVRMPLKRQRRRIRDFREREVGLAARCETCPEIGALAGSVERFAVPERRTDATPYPSMGLAPIDAGS